MARTRSLLPFGFLGLVALCGLACNRVTVEEVRGPASGEWVRISCKHMDKRCFHTAERICPSGYYFADSETKRTVLARQVDADDEERIRATAAQPRSDLHAKTLPPQERWSRSMYSRDSGAILVQCATATASK